MAASTNIGRTAAGEAGAAVLFDVEAPSPGTIRRRRALSHVGFLSGASVVAAILLIALFAPLIAPFDPYEQVLSRRLIPPVWAAGGSWTHIFGTDGFGRDYFSRIVFGSRISLTVGFCAAAISCLVGSTLGIIGGYFGGRVDAVVMYVVNVKLALPGILVALSLVAIVGGSVTAVVLILGFLFWDRFAVVTRAATQQVRAHDFVTAAEAIGASRPRILFREILPNIANQIIVIASLEMAVAILVEAVLSFLGLGVQPPTPSWGLMISEGRTLMFFQPYLIAIPGIAIFTLVIAINMMGDGIRDITAPEGRS